MLSVVLSLSVVHAGTMPLDQLVEAASTLCYSRFHPGEELTLLGPQPWVLACQVFRPKSAKICLHHWILIDFSVAVVLELYFIYETEDVYFMNTFKYKYGIYVFNSITFCVIFTSVIDFHYNTLPVMHLSSLWPAFSIQVTAYKPLINYSLHCVILFTEVIVDTNVLLEMMAVIIHKASHHHPWHISYK